MKFCAIVAAVALSVGLARAGGEGALTNMRFKAVSVTSNGVEILVGYDVGETNRFELFGGSNIAAAGWTVVAATNAMGSTNCVLLLDTNPAAGVRYYEAWDAAADSDWDSLPDGREARIYGTALTLADSDGDGMGDGWEVLYGYDPAVSNSGTGDGDSDGLIDRDEARYGTDPGDDDTDGDGTDDGDEVAQGSDPADDADTGPDSRARTLVIATDQSTSADQLRFYLHRTGTGFSTTWPVPAQSGAQGNWTFIVVQGRHYLLKLLAETALDPPPMSLSWTINPGSDVLVDEGTNTVNVPTVSNIAAGIAASYEVDVEVDVDLQGFAAFRGSNNTMVPDSGEASPAGVLVTPKNDGFSPYLSNPRECKIIARGFSDLDLEGEATRCLRFSSPSKIKLVGGDYGSPTQPPSELDLGSISGVQFTSDVEFEVHMNSGNWSVGNYVDIEYVVKDAEGVDRGADTVRLLGPVVMALGDSVTMGFQRDISGVRRTPPVASGSGWSSSQSWSSYPGTGDWTSLTPPWDNANNRLSDSYQGYRGYLDLVLPGWGWAGESVNGHGPSHMGYNGGSMVDIYNRYPRSAAQVNPCYAIILYHGGYNDVVTGESAANMWSDWSAQMGVFVSERSGRGKTLLIGMQLGKMGTWYSGYSSTKQTQLMNLNNSIDNYTVSGANVRYASTDTENVGHDASDDGLHFFANENIDFAAEILDAIVAGLQ